MPMTNHLQPDQTELLVQGSIKGEPTTQYRLYNLFAPKMMGVCMRYAQNKNEAAEILQEGFIRVFEKLNQFRNEGSLEGWIRRIMVTTALQKFRLQQNRQRHTAIDEIAEQTADQTDLSGMLDAKDLMVMVQQLPPAYRMVFNLYVFEGLKHREIADALGISQGTSKSNLSDARILLQKYIKQSHADLTKKIPAYG